MQLTANHMAIMCDITQSCWCFPNEAYACVAWVHMHHAGCKWTIRGIAALTLTRLMVCMWVVSTTKRTPWYKIRLLPVLPEPKIETVSEYSFATNTVKRTTGEKARSRIGCEHKRPAVTGPQLQTFPAHSSVNLSPTRLRYQIHSRKPAKHNKTPGP